MWKDDDGGNDSSSREDCKLREGNRTIMPSGFRSQGEYLKRFGFKYFKAMHRMAFILLLAAGLSGCSKIGDQPTDKGPKRELPLAEYRDTTILDMYEGSRLSWVLKTKYLVKWPRTEMVRARPVDLVVYDTLGKVLVRVTSDSGAVDEGISFLVASGHVHGRSEKGVDITSDSLRWNKAINQISTDARVRVISEDGDILTGKGFISDAKLDNWQILSDVKGVFQKVGERFQNADTTGAPKPADSTSKAPESGALKPSTAPGQATDSSAAPAAPAPAAPAPAAPAPAAPAPAAPAPAAPAPAPAGEAK
jgi:LPS export ABC transporter protein LptC